MRKPSLDATVWLAYSRVSDGEKQVISPEAQHYAIGEAAARAGARVVLSFHDAIRSDTPLDERPALAAALASMRAVRAGVLCVARRDRLSREPFVSMGVERALAQQGARLISADGAGNGDDPAAAFTRLMLDGAAQLERALIKARTREALAALKRAGRSTGRAPWGWQADASGALVPCPAERATTERARELVASGASLRQAAAALTAEGHRTRLIATRTGPRGGAAIDASTLCRVVLAARW
jgi:DNA invertase Pin-like site-specific DNA recombinase